MARLTSVYRISWQIWGFAHLIIFITLALTKHTMKYEYIQEKNNQGNQIIHPSHHLRRDNIVISLPCSPIWIFYISLCWHPGKRRPCSWADSGYTRRKLWRDTIILGQDGAVWHVGSSSISKRNFRNGGCGIIIILLQITVLLFLWNRYHIAEIQIFPQSATHVSQGTCSHLTLQRVWSHGNSTI